MCYRLIEKYTGATFIRLLLLGGGDEQILTSDTCRYEKSLFLPPDDAALWHTTKMVHTRSSPTLVCTVEASKILLHTDVDEFGYIVVHGSIRQISKCFFVADQNIFLLLN